MNELPPCHEDNEDHRHRPAKEAIPPPFVSVVIPVFNDTERLLMCLNRLDRKTPQ